MPEQRIALVSEDRAPGTYDSGDIRVPRRAVGCMIFVERTAGTGTFTATLRGKIYGTANYYDHFVGSAAQTSFRGWVHPSMAGAGGTVNASAIPSVINLRVVVATSNCTFHAVVDFVY